MTRDAFDPIGMRPETHTEPEPMPLPDPGTITIPQSFLEEIDRLHGAPGHAWLATVPDTLRRVTSAWSLTVSGPPRHGAHGLVIPVRRAQAPMALKLVPRDAVTDTEIAGLRAWDGHGCVQLLAVDEDAGALLMEWLDAGRDLTGLPIDPAVTEAGRLARHLAILPPDPVSFPTSSDRAREIARTLADRWDSAGRPFPQTLLRRLQDLAASLTGEHPPLLATWDLHSENVLWGDRAGWTMIDPMPMVGDPELALGPFLWTRAEAIEGPAHLRRLVDAFVTAGTLDPDRTRSWLAVRLVDYWLWGLGIGLTIDPERCRTLLGWLLPQPDAHHP